MKNLFLSVQSIFNIIFIFVLSLFMPIDSGLSWAPESVTVYSSSKGAYYPRITELKNGTFLCGFSTRDYSEKSEIIVLESNDKGETWSKSHVVASLYPQYDCDNANFLQLENGDLLLAYRAVLSAENETYTSLRTSISHDNGKTWSDHSLIAEYTNPLFKGVWEPNLILIGDKLAVFYANDSLVNNNGLQDWQQNIEYKLFENGSWSERHLVSSGIKTNSRDGMPVLCRLNDGSYALVIEGTKSQRTSKIKNTMFIKLMISKDGLSWNEKKAFDIYYPDDSERSAGAPGIACLPDGRIAVSFQTDENSTETGNIPAGKGYTMKVMVSALPVTSSTKLIKFSNPEEPFDIPENNYALWTAVNFSDGNLIACSGTNKDGNKIVLRKATVEKKFY